MKLCGIWTVFDGEELLKGSIQQIYDYLDKVIIVFQDISNFGNNNDIYDILCDIDCRYDGVEFLRYQPNLNADSHWNQRKKLLRSLLYIQQDYSHYIYLATDEYYNGSQFQKAKQFIIDNDINTSVCLQHTYFMSPVYKLLPMESTYTPFICSLQRGLYIDQNSYPVKVDPSRGVLPIGKFHEFHVDDIVKYHYSWVRKDIMKKMVNHSMCKRYDIKDIEKSLRSWKYGQKVPFFKGRSIELDENRFNINI